MDAKKHHKFLGWLRHQPRTVLLELRNKAYAHVKLLRLVVSVFENERDRRENLALEEAREACATLKGEITARDRSEVKA